MQVHASNKEEFWARWIQAMFTITRVSSGDEGHARISRSPPTVFGVQSYRNINHVTDSIVIYQVTKDL